MSERTKPITLEEQISRLLAQRTQLELLAHNPAWILAPDEMAQSLELFVAAGGKFFDREGKIHHSGDVETWDEEWLWVLPNPLVGKLVGALEMRNFYMNCQEGSDEYPTPGCPCEACDIQRKVNAALAEAKEALNG